MMKFLMHFCVEHLDPIERSILRLSEGLTQIQNEQKYLRMRERVHRDSEFLRNNGKS